MTALLVRRSSWRRTPDQVVDIRSVRLDDPLVRPLLAEPVDEYTSHAVDEYTSRAADELGAGFAPPDGDIVLVFSEGLPVAGGAFRRDQTAVADGTVQVATAELNRVWTHPAHRRRGWARIVLAELEGRAAAVGYRRLSVTTGPHQPEVVALYRSAGFAALRPAPGREDGSGPVRLVKAIGVDVVSPQGPTLG